MKFWLTKLARAWQVMMVCHSCGSTIQFSVLQAKAPHVATLARKRRQIKTDCGYCRRKTVWLLVARRYARHRVWWNPATWFRTVIEEVVA